MRDQEQRLRILLCNWRDKGHLKAGGAEVQTHILASGLAARGHSVTVATSQAVGNADAEQSGEGYVTRHFGSELTCRIPIAAWLWRNRAKFDVVIDEVNTLPFFSRLILPKRTVLWIHQLAREVWLAEAPFPANYIGFALEPVLMRIYRNGPVVTGAQSTAQSLRSFGFPGEIEVIEYALEPPLERASMPQEGLIGYVGRLVPSKRVDHIIRALQIISSGVPSARLTIIGTGPSKERERLKALARDLGVLDRIVFAGRVSNAERDETMSRMDVLAMASLREGWGLVVSEAARFGIPSAVYPVAGLVDAVESGVSGIVAHAETPEALAQALKDVIADRPLRQRMGQSARDRLRRYSEERFINRFEQRLFRLVQQ